MASSERNFPYSLFATHHSPLTLQAPPLDGAAAAA
jgi:hypothetical protein